MLKKINSFIIATDVFNEVSEFFIKKLKLPVPSSDGEFAKFELNGFPIFLAKSVGNISYVAIETDDIVHDFQALSSDGVEFVEPIRDLESGDKAAFFRAPGGFEFMLYQPVGIFTRIKQQ